MLRSDRVLRAGDSSAKDVGGLRLLLLGGLGASDRLGASGGLRPP